MKEFGPPGVIFFSDGFVGVVPEVCGALLLGLVGLMVSLGLSGFFLLQPAPLVATSTANPTDIALRTVALDVISCPLAVSKPSRPIRTRHQPATG